MYYIYVIQSESSGKLYVGSASNLSAVLVLHNRGGSPETSTARPWSLIYYEACLNIHDARERESQLKTESGINTLKQRLSKYFFQVDQTEYNYIK